MAFCFSRLRSSAVDELLVVGSRWQRVLAKPIESVGPPHVQASLAVPYITLIPTLHVASISFYDKVLEYMQHAVKRSHGNCVIMLEGICDNQEEEEAQRKEFQSIMNSKSLREKVLKMADENNLHSPQTMREICAELALDYQTVMDNADKIRLQECYLKPKMAATVGLNLVNNVDTDMKNVQRLLKEEEARLEALGESLPASIAVSDIGKFPLVKKYRECKVAEAARRQCEKWIKEEIEGEVIIPWGFFHTDAIEHYIVKGNRTSDAEDDNENKKVAVFVEDDELVAKVDFGITKELFSKAKTAQEDLDRQVSQKEIKLETEEEKEKRMEEELAKKREKRDEDFLSFTS